MNSREKNLSLFLIYLLCIIENNKEGFFDSLNSTTLSNISLGGAYVAFTSKEPKQIKIDPFYLKLSTKITCIGSSVDACFESLKNKGNQRSNLATASWTKQYSAFENHLDGFYKDHLDAIKLSDKIVMGNI